MQEVSVSEEGGSRQQWVVRTGGDSLSNSLGSGLTHSSHLLSCCCFPSQTALHLPHDHKRLNLLTVSQYCQYCFHYTGLSERTQVRSFLFPALVATTCLHSQAPGTPQPHSSCPSHCHTQCPSSLSVPPSLAFAAVGTFPQADFWWGLCQQKELEHTHK